LPNSQKRIEIENKRKDLQLTAVRDKPVSKQDEATYSVPLSQASTKLPKPGICLLVFLTANVQGRQFAKHLDARQTEILATFCVHNSTNRIHRN
jgi:hypothetical protein